MQADNEKNFEKKAAKVTFFAAAFNQKWYFIHLLEFIFRFHRAFRWTFFQRSSFPAH